MIPFINCVALSIFMGHTPPQHDIHEDLIQEVIAYHVNSYHQLQREHGVAYAEYVLHNATIAVCDYVRTSDDD